MEGKRKLPSGRRSGIVGAALAAVVVAGTVWRAAGAERASSAAAERGGVAGRTGLSIGSLDTVVALPVEAEPVGRGTLVLEVVGTGQTEASRRATIATGTDGRVLALPVEESATVREGQVLATLDARDRALALRSAEAGLSEARARYREMTLFDASLADPVLEAERAAAARARSGLEGAEVALHMARLDLGRTILRAPIAGRVANVTVSVGDFVTAGREIMTVVDIDPIAIEVRVVESELRWLDPGAAAEIALTAFPDTVFHGRIARIDPVVEPESRTARVTVLLANEDGRILPGMFARAALEGRQFRDRVLVPREALLDRDGRPMLFVFEPLAGAPPDEGTARWVYVTPGLSNGDLVELLAAAGGGFPEPGSLVLTGGHGMLVHDARVRITGDAARVE